MRSALRAMAGAEWTGEITASLARSRSQIRSDQRAVGRLGRFGLDGNVPQRGEHTRFRASPESLSGGKMKRHIHFFWLLTSWG